MTPQRHYLTRLWEFSDPQILTAARAGWHGFDSLPLLHQALTDPRPAPIRRLTRDELAGDVRLVDPPTQYRRAGESDVDVIIHNGSDVTWPAFSDLGHLAVVLASGWWRLGLSLPLNYEILPLPRNVHPGESVETRVRLLAPAEAGTYRLHFQVIQPTALMSFTGGEAVSLLVQVR